MLSLVLPKGSLERATLDLFDAADLTVRRSSDRDYHASIDDPRIDKVRFLRPQEIPSYLERGLFDLGITGRDWITETEADVTSLGELQYSKATAQPVRVVLAVPDSTSWRSAADLPEGVRISTEFPSLTRRFLDARGVKAMIIPSYGATEAKVPDIVDAIVDLTETGSSLRKNGLRVLETLLTSYTELIASGPAFADPQKRAAMEDIALLLRGAIQARGNVLLKLNVAADRLADVTEMLPSLSSPTITTLARGDMNAVETVVPKRGVNTLIPALKAAGAQDILEIPISKIVELAVAAWRRHTARVLPVDAEGRVLLLHGWDPRHPDRPFWFTIGGAAEAGESLRDAGARELREETGIVVGPASLGEPIAQNTVEFSWAGYQITQDQTFYAVLVESAEVTLDGMDSWERATTDKYGWLSADDLGPDMPPADPALPDLIRAAAASVRGLSR
jgi:ATP phosphoribosyltransferase